MLFCVIVNLYSWLGVDNFVVCINVDLEDLIVFVDYMEIMFYMYFKVGVFNVFYFI